MDKLTWVVVGFCVGVISFAIAISFTSDQAGADGGSCYGNATCNAGLTCIPVGKGKLCVKMQQTDGGIP